MSDPSEFGLVRASDCNCVLTNMAKNISSYDIENQTNYAYVKTFEIMLDCNVTIPSNREATTRKALQKLK